MSAEESQVASLLGLTDNSLANILPPYLVHITTILLAVVIILSVYACNQLPGKTLPALQCLLDDVSRTVHLLEDTEDALLLRLSLKSHNNDASVCEERYLDLSAVPWASYSFALLRLVRAVREVTLKTQELLTLVKTRLEVERQAEYRAYIHLDTIDLAVPSFSPREMAFLRKIRHRRQSTHEPTSNIVDNV
ncbi:hypothetical protein C8J56DRAFT_1131073 [Mycena floridula]|nr:hypothetical protein C8J56DRAFT_1131073 [Mycena floridula]